MKATVDGRTPCRIADILELDGLTLHGSPGPAVMDRAVRWVQVTELIDPRRYLRADELVCTVGTSLLSPRACRAFVDAVAASGAAGVCFGVGDVHDTVPDDLVFACGAHGVPLLVAPMGLPFLFISDIVTERRIELEGDSELRERAQTGQLLSLVADRLAAPEALRSALEQAGLDTDRLVVGAWSAGVGGHLPDDWVVGQTAGMTYGICSEPSVLREVAGRLGLSCGISEAGPLTTLARSVGAARAALLLGTRSGRVVGPDELASLDGLLEQQPPDRLAPFVDHVLTPLRAQDRDGALEDTLKAFLAENRSVDRAARSLYVHVNTVRHRLARVREVTGRDPFDVDDLVALRIALWAADRRR